jgi:amidohydrolase
MSVVKYENLKEKIEATIDANMDRLFEDALYIGAHPELGFEEFLASKKLTDELKDFGFSVTDNICDCSTAFVAEKKSGEDTPKVGFFCEYDALPEIGHACGHNLIATMSLGAAVGLASVLEEVGGDIFVYGTPAEETGGLKVPMSESGIFDELDAGLITHPNSVTEESGTSYAMQAIRFKFYGKAAHAAAAPEKGINALDSVILLYNGLNALRQHVPKDVLIHGIISNGGAAPNIVPEYAEAEFYIRASKVKTMNNAIERAKKVAHAAADMTGATVEIELFDETYYDLVTNKTLNGAYNKHLVELGETVNPPSPGIGSIDMGNVSYRAPSIHGWLGFKQPEVVPHSREFAERACSEDGRRILRIGAIAMALTGLDVLIDADLRANIRKEFEDAIAK